MSMDQFGNTIIPDLRQGVIEYVLGHEVSHSLLNRLIITAIVL